MRIGTASDFRGKEGEDSSGRSDERELYDIWKPGEGEVRMRSDHPFIRRMRAPFDPSSLEDVEHSFIFEADTSFHFLADTYMFCVSMSKGPEVCRRMLDEFNADMYCKISDTQRFFAVLTSADRRLGASGPARWSRVTYADRSEVTIRSGFSPFEKRSKFRWQDEARAIWGWSSKDLEPFVVKVPDLRPLIAIERNPAAL